MRSSKGGTNLTSNGKREETRSSNNKEGFCSEGMPSGLERAGQYNPGVILLDARGAFIVLCTSIESTQYNCK